MKAGLPSFVFRRSISLKKRIYVVCNSDIAMQAEGKRNQRNGIKHSAGTVSSLISLPVNLAADLNIFSVMKRSVARYSPLFVRK